MEAREILEGMSDEELMAIIEAKKAGEQSPALFRTVEVSGISVRIDLTRARSWKAFRMMQRTQGEDKTDAIAAMLELVEYATDCNEGKILEAMGENAGMTDVLMVIAQIFSECAPKNF